MGERAQRIGRVSEDIRVWIVSEETAKRNVSRSVRCKLEQINVKLENELYVR